jgi:signal transduction histidine kinase
MVAGHYTYGMLRHGCRVLVVIGGVAVVVAVMFAFAVPHPHGSIVAHAWVWGVVVPSYLVGALAVAVRPGHLSARWLGAAGSLVAIETVARRSMPLVGDVAAGWWTSGSVVLQLAVLATTAAIASVLVVFPDDDYRYRYQRTVLRAIWLVVAAMPLMLTVSRPSLFFPPSWFGPEVPNPMFVSGLSPLAAVAERAFHWRVGLWAAGVVAMLVRYRRASARVRQQFMWPLAAALLLTVFDIVYRMLDQAGLVEVQLLFRGWVPGFALLSASILVALLRHRVVGVGLWLRRSILFGGASAVTALAVLGVAGLLGLAAGQRASLGVGVLVTLVAVVALQPVRARLDAWARRWVFGRSVSGSELVRRVGRTLEDAYDTNQLASTLASTVVDGLGLKWARVSFCRDGDGPSEPIAATGVAKEEPVAPDLVVPLIHAGETVGSLECGPKIHGDLSRADEELLATVASQGALAVHNAWLAAELDSRLEQLGRQANELAASRNRILQAQTAERRRIERNVHDGAQQEIIASLVKIRLARNQLDRDPRLAAGTLAELQEDTRRVVENLRTLSRGIHPHVLTNRGIAEALCAQASHSPIDVCVEIASEVRGTRYTEDVEATAYYVVSEGLTNVLKHAGTKEATVRLQTAEDRLVTEVIDHGRGCDGRSAGSGLVGLRDRVESIGGTLEIDSQAGAGTVLRALLPANVANHA